MNDDLKAHLADAATWQRLLYMAFFVLVFNVAEVVIAAVVVFQAVVVLFTGQRNERALALGAQLGMYAYQILQFLTFNSDDPPFPFAEWPSGRAAVEVRSTPGPGGDGA